MDSCMCVCYVWLCVYLCTGCMDVCVLCLYGCYVLHVCNARMYLLCGCYSVMEIKFLYIMYAGVLFCVCARYVV